MAVIPTYPIARLLTPYSRTQTFKLSSIPGGPLQNLHHLALEKRRAGDYGVDVVLVCQVHCAMGPYIFTDFTVGGISQGI